MSNRPITLALEIPSTVEQQDVWDLEERLRQIEGVTTDLRESKNLLTDMLLYIEIAGPYVGTAIAVAGGFNTINEFVKTIYDFIHSKKQEAKQQGTGHQVVILTKDKRIELNNLHTMEEMKEIIKVVLKSH